MKMPWIPKSVYRQQQHDLNDRVNLIAALAEKNKRLEEAEEALVIAWKEYHGRATGSILFAINYLRKYGLTGDNATSVKEQK
jgi:hypothetical protein